MPDTFNPFDLGAWLVPEPDVARRESLQLQKEQTRYLREIARAEKGPTVSALTYEFAQSVSSLTDGLTSLGYDMDCVAQVVEDLRIDVQKGFAGLGALFDWKMNTVISRLEQQQTTYYEIRDLLRYPRKTSANEDKEDARRAIQVAFGSHGTARDQWLERATTYLRAATEKNPFDYTVLLDMGTLLLEAQGQREKALSCFQEAASTARTAGDREYEGKARFFAGRAHEVLEQHEEAYQETRRAVDLRPESQVIVFECSRYCGLTGRSDECAQHLESLLRADVVGGKVKTTEAQAWWAKARASSDFGAAQVALEELLHNLATEAKAKAEETLVRTRKAMTTAEEALRLAADCAGSSHHAPELGTLRVSLESAILPVQNAGYFDYLEEIAKLVGPDNAVHTRAFELSERVLDTALNQCSDRSKTLRSLAEEQQEAKVQSLRVVKEKYDAERNRRGELEGTIVTWVITGLSAFGAVIAGIAVSEFIKSAALQAIHAASGGAKAGGGQLVTLKYGGAVLLVLITFVAFFVGWLCVSSGWSASKLAARLTLEMAAIDKDAESEIASFRTDLAIVDGNCSRLAEALRRVRSRE